MRILFVSTSIPPATDMQTTRNIYLISSLLAKGHKVDILTCGGYKVEGHLFDNILSETVVYRTKEPWVLRWHKYISTHIKIKLLLKLHNVFINYYAIPDIYSGWGGIALKYIKENNLFDYDVIITSSGSYTAHEVGNKWKRISSKTWIAEYGDPWGLDKYGNINRLYYKLEKPLMSICDGFVFTTQSTIDAYKKHYNAGIPYALVPCGFGEPINDNKSLNLSNKLLFTYTGVAFKRDRNLSDFITSVKENRRISAMLVGTISDDVKAQCANLENITITGRVPYEKSLEIIGASDVLVHIGNLGTMQVPGKTYIYLSSKKPILYIQQQPNNDPTLDVLKQFEGVVSCKNNLDEITNAISYIQLNYSELKSKAEKRFNSDLLKSYSWTRLGNIFEEFVTKITKI